MALALYRKYRPATFAEVVGQEHVTEPLRAALAAGRINHAYLFSGPRGCGKTSSARIMARSLNCVDGPTPDPCGACGPCQALAPEGPGSVDVTELDAASHGGVDDARELRDRAFYAPAESRYRLFIIDEAHMVTPQGFNALLKVVEEPPEHLIFIFATTEPDKVLTTIRSRTHHYPFRLIPPSAMQDLLERNVSAEGVAVEPAVFPLVIRAGGGSARDTQSVLDQLLAGAGPHGVTYEHAAALLGVTDAALIDAMVDALAAEDAQNVFGTIDRLAEAGLDPRRFATDLLDRLRDLILLRAVPDAASSGMVSAPEEQIERMVGQAERLQPATLTRYAEILHRGLLEMRGATAPRLLLELLCSRMLLPEVADDEQAMLQRLERLERRIAVSGAADADARHQSPEQAPATSEASAKRTFQRPSQRAAAPVEPAPSAPAPPTREPEAAPSRSHSTAPRPGTGSGAEHAGARAPGQVDAAALRQYWPQVLAAVREMSRSTEALLTGAAVHEVDGSTVVLTHTAAPLVRRLSEQRNIECIATALGRVVSGEWHVRCVHADTVQTSAAQPPGANTPAAREQKSPPARPYEAPAATSVQQPSPGTDAPEPDLPPQEASGPQKPEETGPQSATGAGAVAGTAEASSDPEADLTDPETRAYQLLSSHLGARPLN